VQVRLPKDDNGNWLPDGGWKVIATGQVIGEVMDLGMLREVDEDNNGPDLRTISPQQPPSLGQIGDGLTNFEEFRGFVVRGEHRRTNPFHKDLFISSDLPNGISFAFPNLPTATHRVREDGSEYNANRLINFNWQNSGHGGDIPANVQDSDQKALKILGKMRHPSRSLTILGYTSLIDPTDKSPMSPNETDRIEVYEDALANLNLSAQDTDYVRRTTTGHEVGHGIHICHRPEPPSNCPDPPCTCFQDDGTMVGNDHSIMTSAGVFAPNFTNRPSTYNNYDIGQIRLHLHF
jgi:hypothetical protein